MAGERDTVLVIGGGVAGATAALELAAQGAEVTLVEKDDFLGGHAARLACKALEACQKCNGCLSEARLAELLESPRVRLLRRATVSGLERRGDGFLASIDQRPAYIDPQRCTGCGICRERCPAAEEGALRSPLLAGDLPRLAIDPAVCLYFKDGRSTMCRDLCPEEAIDFDRPAARIEVQARAVVLASGFQPYEAGQKERLGHGRLPNVITALELEDRLRRLGSPARPSDGRLPQRVAFIQCVGSRERLGHNYCSRVCCGYALRLGRMLGDRFGSQVSVFYMDLQSFGLAMDDFLAAARQDLDLVRSMPYDVYAGKDGGVLVEYQAEPGQAPVQRPFDLLVLSVGMTPGRDNPELAQTLGLELDHHGFLRSGPGVFVAGAAARPMDVAEVVAHAGRAARDTLRYLEAS